MPTELRSAGLAVGYGRETVVADVGLRVTGGEFVALVGPNGSGKTTLLRTLTRTLRPMAGSVTLDGQDIYRLSAAEFARSVSFVPQEEQPAFAFTVREVVAMGRMPHRRSSADSVIAQDALHRVGLEHLADRSVTAISGGERQRVTIARALAQQGRLMTLDEPLAHLDIGRQSEVLRLVRSLVTQNGTAVLCAIHDLNLASEYADRIVVLSNGRIVADAPPAEALTSELLRHVYGGPVLVRPNPITGRPSVFTLPVGIATVPEVASTRVHVICGGGSGLPLFYTLVECGCIVSSGVTNLLDVDEEAARAMGFQQVTEAPFCGIGDDAYSEALGLMLIADVVVVAEMPFGPGNLRNLELAEEARRANREVWLMGQEELGDRDFTGGVASDVWNRLQWAGAKRFADAVELQRAMSRRAGGDETAVT